MKPYLIFDDAFKKCSWSVKYTQATWMRRVRKPPVISQNVDLPWKFLIYPY